MSRVVCECILSKITMKGGAQYAKHRTCYWNAIHQLRFQDVRELFCDTAEITWPNTEEVFTLDEFIAVNEAYPGEWEEEVLKCYETGDMIISETMVKGQEVSYLAIGFFTIQGGKITALREYWTAVEAVPEWRKELLKSRQGMHAFSVFLSHHSRSF